MTDDLADANIGMDNANLYREKTITDRKVGTLQELTPISVDGERDENRPVIYLGQTQVLTPAGALPLTFEIDADSLEQAVERFGDHAKQALESTVKRLEEMRREQASSLIVPGSGGGMQGPGGMPGPGGGIQIP